MTKLSVFLAILCIASSCTKSSQKSDGKAKPLFKFQGKDISEDNAPDQLRQQLHEAKVRYHSDLQRVIDEYVIQEYNTAEAQKVNKSPQDFASGSSPVKEPTEEEMKAFYEQRKARIPYPYDVVKKEIRNVMMQERNHSRSVEILETARKAGDFKLLLEEPESPTLTVPIEGHPIKGNIKAKVTVVEFADFKCPHCAEFFNNMKSAWPNLESKINIVFRYFPLQTEGAGKQIAMGAYCAHKQGKFWAYHDLAFENQKTATEVSPKEFAEKSGLDVKQFETCFAAPETSEAILTSRREGEKFGVTATPTFFVNGKKVNADQIFDKIDAATK